MKPFAICLLLIGACSKPSGLGAVDPVRDGTNSVSVPDVQLATDPASIDRGKELFTKKLCVTCHRIDGEKLIGPGLGGVAERRTLRWIARMVVGPEKMVVEDPTAKQLLETYKTPMSNQSVDPIAELPLILSYLRTLR